MPCASSSHQGDCRQWGQIPVHAEDAVSRDQACASAIRETGELGGIGVGIAPECPACEQGTIEQGGMIESILPDRIVPACERRDHR
jgi:hypothetical protein